MQKKSNVKVFIDNSLFHSTPQITKSIVIFFALFLIASIPRLVLLGQIPRGLNWDEVSYAYNAYSISQTGSDEWGVRLPLFLKAFGDFKPALLSYLQLPFLELMGRTNEMVRLPVAILAILSVFAFGYIVFTLTQNRLLSMLSVFFIAISPWHIHYSRIAMDPMVGLSMLLIGLALVLSHKKLIKVLGFFFILLSMITYNAERVFVPLMALVGLGWFFYSQRKSNSKHILSLIHKVPAILIAGIIFLLAAYLLFFSNASSRAKSLIVYDKERLTEQVHQLYFRSAVVGIPPSRLLNNKLTVLTPDFAQRYLSHFSPDFLFFDGNLSPRHAFSMYGNLLLIFIPLVIVGIFTTILKPNTLGMVMIIWLLLSPIPAAVTNDIPHSGRTLQMIVPIAYFCALGLIALLGKVSKFRHRFILGCLMLGLVMFNFLLYFRDYLIFFPEESEISFQGHMKTLADYVSTIKENNTYSAIYLPRENVNPSIFFAWYWPINPTVWQSQAGNHDTIDNFKISEISDTRLACLLSQKNVLIVTVNRSIHAEMLKPNEMLVSQNRFEEPDVLFDVYDTNKLIDPNWTIIDAKCKEYITNANSKSDEQIND